MKKALAFDFGASSGRAIVGISNGNEPPILKEIHRFPNEPVWVNGHFYWDVLRLFHEIKRGLSKCALAGHGDISSIGIDTWGVDYGLLNSKGELIGNPYHYRDLRTKGQAEELAKRLGADFLYSETGIQAHDFNTIAQLSCDGIPQGAEALLFMPDLFAYFLTGAKRCERTIFSTSQLMNIHTGNCSDAICTQLGIDKNLFCPGIEPGEIYGFLKAEIAAETGLPQIPVAAVASHDTASAVFAIPFQKKNAAYISCGTWSLLGLKLEQPILTPEAMTAGFTNEAGAGGSIRFLKNITGAWLLQECRRIWAAAGEETRLDVLDAEAEGAVDFSSIIHPEDSDFTAPPDMTAAIRAYCEKTGQKPPRKQGEYLVLINRSLAVSYKKSLEELEALSGIKIDMVHMVGGGIQDRLLCRFTEEITQRRVITGPIEATAMGNVMMQLI